MWFRNLKLFRFPVESVSHFQALVARLEEHRLRDIGAAELATSGFVSPFGRDADQLTHSIGDFTLFAIGVTDKILPAAVVNDELAARVAKIAEREDRRVGAKERKHMRGDVIADLLPRAFSRTTRTLAYVDLESRWLVIDTSSQSVAELVVSMLRDAFGSFPATPLTPEESPRGIMTHWLATGTVCSAAAGDVADVALGDECDLRDPAEAGAAWSGRRADLESEDVQEHLKSGMQVYRLGLQFDDRMTFVLDNDLGVRKLRFLDVILDQLEAAEDKRAALDSIFALMTLELRRVFQFMEQQFHVPAVATLTLDGGDAPKAMRDAARSKSAAKRLAAMAEEDGGGELTGPEGSTVAKFNAREAAKDPRVSRAMRQFADGIARQGGSVTISSMSDGKVDHLVTIDSEDARRIRKNIDAMDRKATKRRGK